MPSRMTTISISISVKPLSSAASRRRMWWSDVCNGTQLLPGGSRGIDTRWIGARVARAYPGLGDLAQKERARFPAPSPGEAIRRELRDVAVREVRRRADDDVAVRAVLHRVPG